MTSKPVDRSESRKAKAARSDSRKAKAARSDLSKFEGSSPYASELFGIYQPLLGWRSRLRTLELSAGVASLKRSYWLEMVNKTTPVYTPPAPRGKIEGGELHVEVGVPAGARATLDTTDGIVARKVMALATKAGFKESAWQKFTSAEMLAEILRDARPDILAEAQQIVREQYSGAGVLNVSDEQAVLRALLERESIAAGALRRIGETHSGAEIATLMKGSSAVLESQDPFFGILKAITPANSDLVDATISPIGLVRLYRQYFFEFDTFLGPPVQHIWLSPGSVVELLEVSTRKTLIERSTEQAFESRNSSEKSSTDEDELSRAVHNENSANTKLGVTLDTTGSYGISGFIDGSTTVGSSFNVEQSGKDAREQTHRTMHQQTAKLASEIRKSFKSVFKTATEESALESRRYVLNNTTNDLINYELRRKMRRVGVQVQDYGVQLCWQAYVDNPGEELGVAKLVHVAAPADLQGVKDPEAPVMPDPELRDKPVHASRGFVANAGSRIGPQFQALGEKLPLVAPKAGYIYSRAEVVLVSHDVELTPLRAYPQNATEDLSPKALAPAPEVELIDTGDPSNPKERSVRSIALGWLPIATTTWGSDSSTYYWDVEVTVIWKPSQKLLKDTRANYDAAMQTFKAEKERAFREALHKAARDRITAASKIEGRRSEDLREEERIVVYRNLIRKLLEVAGITNDDPKLRHVFAELIQSMFDVDRMLYFVAPEWWTPRKRPYSRQNIGLHPANALERITKVTAAFDKAVTVDWGGEARPADYYISEESVPARFGSSLGWLLQLDGDNLRNAFLNAPWVKAVIPIRQGHEWKALGWLSSDAIEGSDGLESAYQSSHPGENAKILAALKKHVWDDPKLTAFYAALKDPTKIRIIDAIRFLILHVQERHAQSLNVVSNPSDPDMTYLPTDEVYERGFDPLPGGFKATATAGKPFEVFDQWVEVLPTDQIVPVEVSYDPRTGQQK